ncbi:MAG: molecular chaperone DnaK [Tenericutes bacterium]|nr:MAG: molecular chaperone DnaK [Mycoplasmatota bacterium]
MRVGIGDLSKGVASYHYENPTIMEFNNLERFINAYHGREGRPFTQWKDLTISHTAFNSLINSQSEDFNTFLSELKQWAGDKKRKLKVIDKEDFVKDLGSFLDLDDKTINPIELYAYYLGLYINNQHNGIFMNYILSFPVTYEVEIRNKIIASFEKGIKKSLPLELHLQEGAVEQLSVVKGASEPAAYAVIALQEYGFEPIDDEKVFYGIFDFGGGTTDFDFGIYKEANGKNQRRYDFVIEHFGAGGDRYLGGENLLELLAFEVFKKNKDKILESSMQFVLPPECRKFPGSETLLSNSREAKMNTKVLMEKLRPFWEGKDDEISEIQSGVLSLNMTNSSGEIQAGFELDVDIDEMHIILKSRIKKGVVSFFDSLREAFSNSKISLKDIKEINIFLAGNSSKSHLLADIFEEEISKRKEEIHKELQFDESMEIFKIYPPLGQDDEDNPEKPTGKTGVAFGLIETRKGGKTLVVDHNTDENNINFKCYLGMSKRKKFRVIIDRDTEYNQWIDFIDASEDTFEVYYASIAMASTNQLDISDNSVKKKMLKIDVVDENALVYIRLVNATDFEYVVATENGIKNNEYLCEIQKVAL